MAAQYTVDRIAWFAKKRALVRKDGFLELATVNITQGIAENPGFLLRQELTSLGVWRRCHRLHCVPLAVSSRTPAGQAIDGHVLSGPGRDTRGDRPWK